MGLAPPRVVVSKKPTLRAHLGGGVQWLATLLTALPLTPTLAFGWEERDPFSQSRVGSQLRICRADV